VLSWSAALPRTCIGGGGAAAATLLLQVAAALLLHEAASLLHLLLHGCYRQQLPLRERKATDRQRIRFVVSESLPAAHCETGVYSRDGDSLLLLNYARGSAARGVTPRPDATSLHAPAHLCQPRGGAGLPWLTDSGSRNDTVSQFKFSRQEPSARGRPSDGSDGPSLLPRLQRPHQWHPQHSLIPLPV
jgi:hypothetical protein